MNPTATATATAINMIEVTPAFKIGSGLLAMPPRWSVSDLAYRTRVSIKDSPLQATEIATAALSLFACSLDGLAGAEARLARFNAFLVGLLDHACRVAGADAECTRRSQSLLHSVFVRQYQAFSNGADVLIRQPAPAAVAEPELELELEAA